MTVEEYAESKKKAEEFGQRQKKAMEKILTAIHNGEQYARDGYFLVNKIGVTTYIAVNDLTVDELNEIARDKEERESGRFVIGA